MKIVYLLKKLEPIAIEKIFYIAGYLGLRGYSSKRARYGFPQQITIYNGQLPSTAIEALFLQFNNGVSFATAGQDAPTKPTFLRWAYN
jgi:hypothetical protein